MLVKKISDDIGEVKECKKITPIQLKQLGYLMTERCIPIGREPAKYNIYEIIDETTKKSVSFCYLYSEVEGVGVILPDTFERYVAKANS